MADITPIDASQYTRRVDLDSFIRNTYGMNIGANRTGGIQIQGTAVQLQQLHLSASTTVYGIPVVVLQDNQ